MIVTSVLCIAAHLTSMFLPEEYHAYWEVIPMTISGVSFALYGTVSWGTVPFLVKDHEVGVAFGLVDSI